MSRVVVALLSAAVLSGCANGKGPNLPPREAVHPPTSTELQTKWVVQQPLAVARANVIKLLTSYPAYRDVISRETEITAGFRADEAHKYVDCGTIEMAYIDKAGLDRSGVIMVAQSGTRVVNSWVDVVYGVGTVTELRQATIDGTLAVALVPVGTGKTELTINVVFNTTIDLSWSLNQPLDGRMGYPLNKSQRLQASSFNRPWEQCGSTMHLERLIAATAEGRLTAPRASGEVGG